MIVENGLFKGVLSELECVLEDYELIKVCINVMDWDDKKVVIDVICLFIKVEFV